MSVRWLPLAFVLVLFTGSCTDQEDTSVEVYKMNPSAGYEVLFYSNQSTIELEEEYINALLELKISNPEESTPLTKATTGDSSDNKQFPQYPALVIQREGHQIATITGKKAKRDILKVLNDSIKTPSPS